VKVGVSICEDAWSPAGPILTEAAGGAELIVNLNASPYYAQRLVERETMLATRAADASVPILYANLVGGQDELVFDGASLVFDEQGMLIARGRQFETDLLVVDIDVSSIRAAGSNRARCRRSGFPIRTRPTNASHHGWSRRFLPCTRCTRRSCSARVITCARTASTTS
jgi:NAD+ synthase (glutamine-hydrolysing)